MNSSFIVLVALLLSEEKNGLVARAYPNVSTIQLGIGCSSVLLVAEITGRREVEDWYCPRVEWIKPDGTVSMSESDCPVFAEREEFPRRWSLRVCAPPSAEAWEVMVRLSKSGRVFARTTVRFLVR